MSRYSAFWFLLFVVLGIQRTADQREASPCFAKIYGEIPFQVEAVFVIRCMYLNLACFS